MGINSRAKGAGFENLLAKMIREAFGTDKDTCYRTPLSGGHQAYSKKSPGDLLVSDSLFKRFPFVVEAKHRKTFHPASFFKPTKDQRGWITHLFVDLAKSPRASAHPLLICRGQATPIFAAMPLAAFRALGLKLPHSYMGWHFEQEPWMQIQFHSVLSQLVRRAKRRGL